MFGKNTGSCKIIKMTNSPNSIVRGTYYTFVFFAPLEYLHLEIAGASLTKIFGYVFLLTAFMQPQVVFGRIPKMFWLFLSYVGFVSIFGFLMNSNGRAVFLQGFTFLQLLMVFLLSYNLMREDAIKKGTLLTLVLSSTFISLYLLLEGSILKYGRMTLEGINPNTPGALLALGLTAFVGMVFFRQKVSRSEKILFWICVGFFVLGIVSTGSRGSFIALVISLMVLLFQKDKSQSIVKLGFLMLFMVAALVLASYQIDAVRTRWEMAFTMGDTAGRDRIYGKVWEMFQERPMFGWGPADFREELGHRLGLSHGKSPHNMVFWLILEGGVFGAAFFLAGLWGCWRISWNTRGGNDGALPLALFTCLMIVDLSGVYIFLKVFWIFLAYILVSGHYPFGASNKRQVQQGAKMLQEKHLLNLKQ